MREVAHRDGERGAGMDALEVSVCGSGVEVVGDGAPAVVKVEVNRSRGVVGVEHDARRHDVVGGVERVEGRTGAVHEPENVGAFQAVEHASAVGVGVGPVGTGLVFHGIGNAIAVKVVGLNVIRRIVLRVGAVKVFATVVHTALVGIVSRRGRDPNIL